MRLNHLFRGFDSLTRRNFVSGAAKGLLGLSAWGRRPEPAIPWCAECLDRQETLGAYDTALLALVLFAAHATSGLVGSLKTS